MRIASIFIEELQRILGDLPGVEIVTDDILIYGAIIKEHDERLRAVLEKARSINLKLNANKSKKCRWEYHMSFIS